MLRSVRLSEICGDMELKFIGADRTIHGLNLCNRISMNVEIISYITDTSYVDNVLHNKAICCLVTTEEIMKAAQKKMNDRVLSYILNEHPEKTFYDIHEHLYNDTDFYEKYEFESQIGRNCSIAPTVVIEKGVTIGNNVIIGANTVIRKGTEINDDCEIGCNNTVGSEGFQVLKIDGECRKIHHVGGLMINENVSIGDNNTICNSLFEGKTYIGKNTKIDNLVYVGHNGYIGSNVIITSGTMLCGSCIVEDEAWIGVNSSVLNKVTIGMGAKIGMGSVVTRDIPEGVLAYGIPCRPKCG